MGLLVRRWAGNPEPHLLMGLWAMTQIDECPCQTLICPDSGGQGNGRPTSHPLRLSQPAGTSKDTGKSNVGPLGAGDPELPTQTLCPGNLTQERRAIPCIPPLWAAGQGVRVQSWGLSEGRGRQL